MTSKTFTTKNGPSDPKSVEASAAAPAETAGGDGHVISVIIPTIERASLERSKAAIARQTRPADEVIVVVDTERRGPSWALNEGIRRAKGDLITFALDGSRRARVATPY